MNKDQIEGLAKVLDNLGTAATVTTVASFFGFKIPSWQLALIAVSGILLVWGGYCLRKLAPSSCQSSKESQASLPEDAP